jgi:hypothetical protein
MAEAWPRTSASGALAARQLAQQEAQVLDEAEVEHAVGFIEDADLAGMQDARRPGARSRSAGPGVAMITSQPECSCARCLS